MEDQVIGPGRSAARAPGTFRYCTGLFRPGDLFGDLFHALIALACCRISQCVDAAMRLASL